MAGMCRRWRRWRGGGGGGGGGGDCATSATCSEAKVRGGGRGRGGDVQVSFQVSAEETTAEEEIISGGAHLDVFDTRARERLVCGWREEARRVW